MIQRLEILEPQPKLAPLKQKNQHLSIAVLSENMRDEKRVALTPLGVSAITRNGNKVYVVSGSGLGANYDDEDYRQAGAEIVDYQRAVRAADVLVKVSPFSYQDLSILGSASAKMKYLALAPIAAISLKLTAKDLWAMSFAGVLALK
jgi:alanine dehydrogenase